jgi:hypothetical protein
MDSQEQLDKWIASCLNHYNLKSINKMKTTEERLLQLETAHSRLYNQFNTLHQDFVKYREVMEERLSNLKGLINTSTEEVPAVLPETLINGKEYKAVVTEIIKSTSTKWKGMEYTNWEVKLEGKDKYVFVAFIPTEYKLAAGDNVRFTYGTPFQLRKLKQI